MRTVLSFLAALSCALLLSAGASAQQPLQKLVLFGQPSVNNDAIWMAIANGYYREAGIDLDYRPFPSGTTAFQSFRAGQGDIVMTGDLPAMQYFLENPEGYRLLAVIERDAKGYVAIASKQITKPQDLVGKTVATRVGSTGSWFISEYLTHNGVDPGKVTVKNLDTQLLPTAVCGGDIAAFFIWQPIGSRALEICPDKVHQLTDATGYIQGYLVAGARPEWLNTPAGADLAKRFLQATMRGRDKAEKEFAAVAAYAAAKLSLSEAATRAQWDTNNRPIAIDQVFYDDFCSESRWAQASKLNTRPLDFKAFTAPQVLQSIDPKIVSAPPSPC